MQKEGRMVWMRKVKMMHKAWECLLQVDIRERFEIPHKG